jgi:acyl-CoA reductase-like NAD-dependent aldehyde dehydrogenase
MTTTEKGNTNSALRAVATKSRRDQAEINPGELSEVFARQRAAFDRNRAPSLAERRAILRKLARLVEQNRLIFVEAANADFGNRAAVETEMS